MAKDYKYILGIDSSTSVLKIGLRFPDGKIVIRENSDRFRHAEFIFALIDDIIVTESIEKAALDGIVVSTGPGSFTGLRVGMAAAKGLAVSLDIPVAGISTFSALTAALYKKFGRAAILIPSRKDEYYLGFVESENFDENNIEVIRTGQLEEKSGGIPVIGVDFDIKTRGLPIKNPIDYSYSIDELIAVGLRKLIDTAGDNLNAIEPFYVQKFPAKKPQ